MQAARVDGRGLFFPQESNEAIPVKGMDVVTLFGWASRLERSGRAALSVSLFESWIAFNSEHPLLCAVYFNFAVVLMGMNDSIGGINAYREAIRLRPDFLPPHVNLGRALESVGYRSDAVAAWLKGLEHVSDITGEALSHKITMLTQTARILEESFEDAAAEDALRQALDLDPNMEEAALHWMGLRQRQCIWPTVVGSERASRATLLAANSPLSLSNISDDPLFLLGCAYAYGASTVARPSFEQLSEVQRRMKSGRPLTSRIRVGYVSSDLREHAVGYALTDLFESHDRSRVEIFVYYCGPEREDPTSLRFRNAAEHWLDVNNLSDFEFACRIADDSIEILVDLNGYTKFARTGAFAHRPTPVAVNWFGYPGSMATPYHHYLIADPVIIPPESERFYSEEIVRLPCYQPNDRKRVPSSQAPTRADFGLPANAFVFCSFNGTQKLTQRIFENWLTILDRTPGSVLWMLTGTKTTNERLRRFAFERGIVSERIVFAEKLRNSDHLARYPLADLFLDSFPYGAHTTASDALWMGVPIVTLKGRSFATRVCSSLLEAADMSELVAHSAAEYVDLACSLASDSLRMTDLRNRLRLGRDRSVLFDTRRLASSLEQAYFAMRERHLRGLTPKPDLRNLAIYHEVGASLDYETIDAADDAAYFATWRDALIRRDANYPIEPDARFWTG